MTVSTPLVVGFLVAVVVLIALDVFLFRQGNSAGGDDPSDTSPLTSLLASQQATTNIPVVIALIVFTFVVAGFAFYEFFTGKLSTKTTLVNTHTSTPAPGQTATSTTTTTTTTSTSTTTTQSPYVWGNGTVPIQVNNGASPSQCLGVSNGNVIAMDCAGSPAWSYNGGQLSANGLCIAPVDPFGTDGGYTFNNNTPVVMSQCEIWTSWGFAPGANNVGGWYYVDANQWCLSYTGPGQSIVMQKCPSHYNGMGNQIFTSLSYD